MKNQEYIGYMREYYIDTQYMGYLLLDDPDRELFGYAGKMKHVANENIAILAGRSSARIIPAGTQYITFLRPLSGRLEK